jgi:hypothetical protein
MIIKTNNLTIISCLLLVAGLLLATPTILFDSHAQTIGSSSTISGQGSTNTIVCGTNTISTQSTTIVFSASTVKGTLSGTWTIQGYFSDTLRPFTISGTINQGQIVSNSYKLIGTDVSDFCVAGSNGVGGPSTIGPSTVTISGLCGTGVQINFQLVARSASTFQYSFLEHATFTGNVVCTWRIEKPML